MTMLEFK